MFTGLIEDLGTLQALRRNGDAASLSVAHVAADGGAAARREHRCQRRLPDRDQLR